MKALISRFVSDDSGATAIEYGLIAGLIAVVAIAGFSAVGTELKALFGTVESELQKAGTSGAGGGAGGGTGGTTTGG